MSHYSTYHIFFVADDDPGLLVVDDLAGCHGFDDARLAIPRLPYGPLALRLRQPITQSAD